jgi:hypothetical protein
VEGRGCVVNARPRFARTSLDIGLEFSRIVSGE